MTSQQSQQTPSLALQHLQLSSASPTTPRSPHSMVSREEIARRAAARMRQGGLVVPYTEEWVEARREPLRRKVVTIRARFEGPKVRFARLQAPSLDLDSELTRVGRQKVFWRYFVHIYRDQGMVLTGLEALNTLISNAVKQCETPEGPKRIKWSSELVKARIRSDPDGPAEQFLTLVRCGFAPHGRPICLQSSRRDSVMYYTNSLSTTTSPNGHKLKNVEPSRYRHTGRRTPPLT